MNRHWTAIVLCILGLNLMPLHVFIGVACWTVAFFQWLYRGIEDNPAVAENDKPTD